MSEEKIYNDIINLPHHVSANRPHMSAVDRAAQFSPFAALTGHDAALRETARLTDSQTELDDSEKEIINCKLRMVISEKTEISIRYFMPDSKKSGGAYLNTVGYIKKIDAFNNAIIMSDGKVIPVECIRDVEVVDQNFKKIAENCCQ